jgi:hypothetical protein
MLEMLHDVRQCLHGVGTDTSVLSGANFPYQKLHRLLMLPDLASDIGGVEGAAGHLVQLITHCTMIQVEIFPRLHLRSARQWSELSVGFGVLFRHPPRKLLHVGIGGLLCGEFAKLSLRHSTQAQLLDEQLVGGVRMWLCRVSGLDIRSVGRDDGQTYAGYRYCYSELERSIWSRMQRQVSVRFEIALAVCVVLVGAILAWRVGAAQGRLLDAKHMKIDVADLASYAAEGDLLVKQRIAGSITRSYFKVHSEMWRDKIEEIARKYATREPAPELTTSFEEVHVLSQHLLSAANGVTDNFPTEATSKAAASELKQIESGARQLKARLAAMPN